VIDRTSQRWSRPITSNARWYRFLPSGDTREQKSIMDRLAQRFKEKGGMTPALSERSATVAFSILGR
jgi:hypothetical protein